MLIQQNFFYDEKEAEGFPPKVQKALDSINGVIGQPHLKEHFETMCYKAIKQQRLKKLDPTTQYGPSSFHMVFRGNPGTGKTLIAGLVGTLMEALGVIPCENFRVVQLREMKGRYIGQTPELMAKTFAKPGVYFIDEAYAILQRDDDSYGVEILAALCEIMENRRHEIVIIMAGYKDDMIKLFRRNAGLQSRFHWIFDFHDYSAEHLLEMSKTTVKKARHCWTAEALEEFRKDLHNGLNGRDNRNMIEEIDFCQAQRTGKCKEYTLDSLRTLTVEDVIAARKRRQEQTARSKSETKSESPLLQELFSKLAANDSKE